MDSGCWIRCLSINLRRNSLVHIAAAVLLTLLVPVLFSISALPESLAAQPLEMYLPLTGMVLLVPVILPEQDKAVRETVRSRRTEQLSIYIMRILYSAAVIAVLYTAVVLLMRYKESDIPLYMIAGGTAGALFTGALGFAAACTADNAIAGYMVSMFYYMLNYTAGSRLGRFYLFSVTTETDISKWWLAAGALILTAAGLAVMKLTRRI